MFLKKTCRHGGAAGGGQGVASEHRGQRGGEHRGTGAPWRHQKSWILPGKMMKMVISLGENDDITWEDGDFFLKLVIFSRKRVDLTKQGRPKWRFGWGAGIYWGYTRSDDLESCS